LGSPWRGVGFVIFEQESHTCGVGGLRTRVYIDVLCILCNGRIDTGDIVSA
jgi:hypothetical protein